MKIEKLLLHHCCAPCSPKVVESLRADFTLESFWFNPNVHPKDEHDKRRASFLAFTVGSGIKAHNGIDMLQEKWIEEAGRMPDRCMFCYSLRLRATARKALELGIKNFSTTLLSSPYQKHEIIKALGEEIGKAEGVTFIYRDFRPAYYEGKNLAYRQGSYMQKYCGCVYSKESPEVKKPKRV